MKDRSKDTPLEEGSDEKKGQSIHDVQSIYEGSTNTASAMPSGFLKRTSRQKPRPWTYYPQHLTSYLTYFERPFFLLDCPSIVIVSTEPFRRLRHYHPQVGIICHFGCTSGITNSTIYEILSAPPYNLTDSQTGLV